jgi:RNA polymerase sigma-70 factor (ECF subfamily)
VGLRIVDRLLATSQLPGYHLLHSTRADLLRRLGRMDEAADSYRRALAFTGNSAERSFLERRLAECAAAAGAVTAHDGLVDGEHGG